jgi:hypothetical protein
MCVDNRDESRNVLPSSHAVVMNDALPGDLIGRGLEGAISAMEEYGIISLGVFTALDADDFLSMRLLPAQRKALAKFHGLVVGGDGKDIATNNGRGQEPSNRRAEQKIIAALLSDTADGRGGDSRCLSRSQSGENCNKSRGNLEMQTLTKSHLDSETSKYGKGASVGDTYGWMDRYAYGCTFKCGFEGSFAEVAKHICNDERDAGAAGGSMLGNKHVRKQENGNISDPTGRWSSDKSEGWCGLRSILKRSNSFDNLLGRDAPLPHSAHFSASILQVVLKHILHSTLAYLCLEFYDLKVCVCVYVLCVCMCCVCVCACVCVYVRVRVCG